jgi:hypothetical protein
MRAAETFAVQAATLAGYSEALSMGLAERAVRHAEDVERLQGVANDPKTQQFHSIALWPREVEQGAPWHAGLAGNRPRPKLSLCYLDEDRSFAFEQNAASIETKAADALAIDLAGSLTRRYQIADSVVETENAARTHLDFVRSVQEVNRAVQLQQNRGRKRDLTRWHTALAADA